MHNAIIIDIDGTVTIHTNHRPLHCMDERLLDDVPNRLIISLVERTINNENLFPIFLTARSVAIEHFTRDWISRHFNLQDGDYLLLMRPFNDLRENHEVKEDLLRSQIFPKYNPKYVLEDEVQNTVMFTSMNLDVFHPNQMLKMIGEGFRQSI